MKLFAADAFVSDGWMRDVLLEIDASGTIARVSPDASADGAERASGPVVPGMPNVHSHAFQRALAGRTGRTSAESDSFWTWREAMHGFVDSVETDAFEAIAAQAYVEMVKAGYTAVGEFHYVHHAPRGERYADRAELSLRIVAAAREAGIGLTLLPVLYAHGGFGGAPPALRQRRFVHAIDEFAALFENLSVLASNGDWQLGIAPHSLRAVTADELAACIALVPRAAPIHIHVAEQPAEVADCVAWSGARPVEWLLDHAAVDERWCIVHATHMTEVETKRLAASGAVAGLAPTTEADLGDGIFAARAWFDAGGAFAIGSDSNTIIDPCAELRQLEWSQRLARNARNVLADPRAPLGAALYARAARGGAQALAQRTGALAPGNRADLVVINDDDPALAAQPVGTLLDAAIFGPCRNPVRDVMIGGRWIVRDGRHRNEDAVLERFRDTVGRMPA